LAGKNLQGEGDFASLGAAANSTAQIPRFEGELSPERADHFNSFLGQNAHSVVYLNMWFDSNSKVITSHDSGFSIRTDGSDGELPLSGWSYEVHANRNAPESRFGYYRGTYKIVGYFVVSEFSGPYQGFMCLGLRVVPTEAIGGHR
jgi:hypothetical protein